MTGFLATKNIVDVENVIAVLVVIAIVLDTFTWFGQYTPGVPRRLIVEGGIAYSISRRQVYC